MAEKRENEGWKGFLDLCSKVKSPADFKEFFELFLTHEEKANLATRYLIVKALEEGILTQREIAQKFQVSISQITRGSNALKIVESRLRKFLQDHEEKI